MNLLPFKKSSALTLGTELELQIINPRNEDLIGRAKDLLALVEKSDYNNHIKPEITQSMIEVNSSIHDSAQSLEQELININEFLLAKAQQLNVKLCGGGTHPFQKWYYRKIFPSLRFMNLSNKFGYLAKRFTVFALHVHVGCSNAEDAIYLCHAFSRYLPQLIAISASSPYYQNTDTEFDSSRTNVVSAFPLSGHMPFITTWEKFSNHYQTMLKLKIAKSIKDFYWDIRPKPEFGTVEIRICDTPLTIGKASIIAAYIQTLAHYLLCERPFALHEDMYLPYEYNRFQASRFGYDGKFINPFTQKNTSIHADLLETLNIVKPYADSLGNDAYISQLQELVLNKKNDARSLRLIYEKYNSLNRVVEYQCQLWKNNLTDY